MVSHKFCEKFAAKAPSGAYRLQVFGEEMYPAYDRVHLSEYFSGKNAKDLVMASHSWYDAQGIELCTGTLVTKIDREKRCIYTNQGDTFPYDSLVLAMGSVPFIPSIEGVDKKGVFVYRTLEDLEAIAGYGAKLKAEGKGKAVILGGGLLGLEAAKATQDIGLETHVVEFAPRLMPRQLDEVGGKLLRDLMVDMGIAVHLSKDTQSILGNGSMTGMKFKDGESLQADMLVISAGIRPRDELARACALDTGTRGGIRVDDCMRSSDPDIYVIGEVALYQEQIYGLVAPGYEMAEVALAQILGEERRMEAQVDMSAKLKLMGVDVASFGEPFPPKGEFRMIAYEDKWKNTYKRINLSVDGKRLLGGMLVGDASDYNMLLQITKNGMSLPPNPEDLILGAKGGEAIGSVLDLPDEAVICSCENITKQQICQSVLSGACENVKQVAKCTSATTGCGGCKPMVVDLVNESLKSIGKAVKQALCEHFPFSRRELYDIIKVKNITSYEEALDTIGKGDGCEACKPALASIFGSIYNELAVVQETIQDTNDRFLANIQRNGTYSVVPRVPGGEITPDKLIAIGEVAKKYDLYTKITGGQRIDMFGARLDQLPYIWEELIEAGFESGHAYGKALRTVKSCVGSTWCRYGMDESVSFAIELEERYKGIRSPHKLKGGVSGCIRECAEARCKDFGVIATENGWNLYVCGNGGAKPKHALLLAENLEKTTCIKYIDRFLMFYLRTAPPLTRTAAWLEKLEGGLPYLKDVVVHDSLGIADTLEQEMKVMVETFKCEWKEVVQNPELRKRFRHFINSDQVDDNISFIPMRGQKMPSRWK